jgi:hypothetical protein
MPRVLSSLLTVPLALFAAACSDPPPTPPAAGVSLTLSPASATEVDLGSRSCNAGPAGSFTYGIGMPDSGRTVENGKSGVTVSCTVRANGVFSANASGTDVNGHRPVSFTFNGTIKDPKNKASNPGGMTFFAPDAGQLITLGTPYPDCTYGPVTTLKKGAILSDIDCPLIGTSEDSTGGCKVHGTIAFEYCLTGEEQD